MPGIKSIAEKAIPLRSNSRLLKQKSPQAASSGKQPPAQSVITIDAGEAMVANVDMTPSTGDMPSKGDQVEEQLYAKYKADLWRHRAHKQGVLLGSISGSSLDFEPPPIKKEQLQPHANMAGAIPISVEADGSLTLKTRVYGKQTESAENVKKEPEGTKPHKADGLKDEPQGGNDSDDLDEYARAALAAMGSRTERKKAEQAEKAAEKRKQGAISKRPAGYVKAEHVKKEVKVEEVSKANILKAMPKAASEGNPDPVNYGGGVVYTVQKESKFRCLRVRGDKYSEKSVMWGKARTKKKAWKECIDAIDAQPTKKKKST